MPLLINHDPHLFKFYLPTIVTILFILIKNILNIIKYIIRMKQRKNQLRDIVLKLIAEKGPISFKEFMEQALYHPQFGYYTSKKQIIGKEGDFVTSSSYHPIFGYVLAKKTMGLNLENGKSKFSILEIGAGKGLLSIDILKYFKKYEKEIYQKTEYLIVEKSPVMKEVQKSLAKKAGELKKVKWKNSIEKLKTKKFTGVIICNELLDSFPVHLIKKMKGKYFEMFVSFRNNRFVEIFKPMKNKEVANYLKENKITLPDNFIMEINLDTKDFFVNVSKILKKGYLIIIDYGYLQKELLKPLHRKGTLLCYHKHQVSENPFVRIGSQDITSHLNFSFIIKEAKKNGFEKIEFIRQSEFLISSGLSEILNMLKDEDEKEYLIASLAAKNLFLPSRMGDIFKVLVLKKQ
jgi:SAM-dependent MidA family methyltransferase